MKPVGREVELYDPHPGVRGAAERLSAPMVNIAAELAGKIMTLDDALGRIQTVVDETGGSVHVMGDTTIAYTIGPHTYTLLRFI